MTDCRISGLIYSLYPSLVDYDPEKVLKRLMGRADAEDALLRLDSLTKEESLMTVARNLEVTCHVDGNVGAIKKVICDVNNNVKATKELVDVNVKATKGLTNDVGENMEAIERVARNIDDNVKALRKCTQCPLTFLCTYQPFFLVAKTATGQLKCLSLPCAAVVVFLN